MKAYTMTSDTLTETSNQVKEIFLESMVKENKISQELADEMNGYCVVVSEKGFFGKFWDRIKYKDGENKTLINVVKIVT